MEQIQQHEWEYKGSSEKITTYHCKRCPCVKMEFHNRWHTVTYNDGKGNKVSEEPACITRYPEQPMTKFEQSIKETAEEAGKS